MLFPTFRQDKAQKTRKFFRMLDFVLDIFRRNVYNMQAC